MPTRTHEVREHRGPVQALRALALDRGARRVACHVLTANAVRSIVSAIAIVAAGCEDYEVPPPAPTTPRESEQAARDKMHERFRAADAMELAIAQADLETGRREARAVDMLDEPDVSASSRPFLADVRTAAHRVAVAISLDAAADGVALVGRACGRCHEATGARVRFESAPAVEPKLGVNMAGHQLAARQLWEGLIGPSDPHWQDGARSLATFPPDVRSELLTRISANDLDDVSRIRMNATSAARTTAEDERAMLFGRVLAACAHCHVTVTRTR